MITKGCNNDKNVTYKKALIKKKKGWILKSKSLEIDKHHKGLNFVTSQQSYVMIRN